MARKTGSANNYCIDYVELGVANIERSRAFYGSAFGWTFTEYGDSYCEFQDGRLTGGFTTLWQPRPGGALIVLFADDLEGTVKRVEDARGKVTRPIYDFPGGRRFHFVDPDGYEFAVWAKPR